MAEIANFYLEHKADPDVRDAKGQTLLHKAAWHGDLDFIKLCVQHGKGDITAEDADGHKPVDLAALRGHAQIMQYLDAHSVDLRCICRQVIRNAIGKKMNSIRTLPLPSHVKLHLNYYIPYPGFEAVVVPPSPWTKETLLQKKTSLAQLRLFIEEHANSEFIHKHGTLLDYRNTGKGLDELIEIFQEMYLWESFKPVIFEEPAARVPRYSMTKLKKEPSIENTEVSYI